MKKHILYFIAVSMNSNSFGSIESLETKAFKAYFNSKNWPTYKEDFKNKLLNKDIADVAVFVNRIFDGLDFSGLDFRNQTFKNCVFKNIKFDRCDLRSATFEDCHFFTSLLRGTLLYYPHESSKEEAWAQGFKFPEYQKAFYLLGIYSDMMNQSREVNTLEHAECLNKLFSSLRFDLEGKDLRGLNLTRINFRNAQLLGAELQGAWITDSIRVPDYKYDMTELFEKWIKSTPEEEIFYQGLVNGGFNLFRGVDIVIIRKEIQSKKNLQNAYLINAQLQGIDLSYTDFRNANLIAADLRGSTLIGCDLTGAILARTKFQNAWITDSILVPDYEDNMTALFKKWIKSTPEEENFYQMLVNSGFNLFKGVDLIIIREGIRFKKNLKKINLYDIQLEELDLNHADLQEASIKNCNLQKSNLNHANLQSADLENTDLSHADLSYAELQNANLRNVKLEGSNLIGANLGGVQLSSKFYLPDDCKDRDLTPIYHSCKDKEAQAMLIKIIIAKKVDCTL